MIDWLSDMGSPVRIVVEASGIYGVDLCYALSQAGRIEVMVVNSRAAKDYRRALRDHR